MPQFPETVVSLLAALGLGRVIGAVRQRQHPDTLAGLRDRFRRALHIVRRMSIVASE